MTSFPFLRLPAIPAGNVLEYFSPFELIKLLLTSKKAAVQIKLGSAKHMRIALDFSENSLEISSKNDPNQAHQILIIKKPPYNKHRSYCINGHSFQFEIVNEKTTLFKFWNDEKIKLETLGVYFSNTFGCPFDSIYTESQLSFEKLQNLLNSSTKKPNELERFRMRRMNINENELVELLVTVNITEELLSDVNLSPHFPMDLFDQIKLVHFENTFWFTLDHLLQMNCPHIYLYGSRLTINDLGVFLQKWKLGDYPNLESLRIRSSKFDYHTPIMGMVSVDWNNRKIAEKQINVHKKVKVNYGIHVQRDDGVRATMSMYDGFSMIVWN